MLIFGYSCESETDASPWGSVLERQSKKTTLFHGHPTAKQVSFSPHAGEVKAFIGRQASIIWGSKEGNE